MNHCVQSVIGTLVQYSDQTRGDLRRSILSKVASLMTRCNPDPVWCVTALRNTVLVHQAADVTTALANTIVNGMCCLVSSCALSFCLFNCNFKSDEHVPINYNNPMSRLLSSVTKR